MSVQISAAVSPVPGSSEEWWDNQADSLEGLGADPAPPVTQTVEFSPDFAAQKPAATPASVFTVTYQPEQTLRPVGASQAVLDANFPPPVPASVIAPAGVVAAATVPP